GEAVVVGGAGGRGGSTAGFDGDVPMVAALVLDSTVSDHGVGAIDHRGILHVGNPLEAQRPHNEDVLGGGDLDVRVNAGGGPRVIGAPSSGEDGVAVQFGRDLDTVAGDAGGLPGEPLGLRTIGKGASMP